MMGFDWFKRADHGADPSVAKAKTYKGNRTTAGDKVKQGKGSGPLGNPRRWVRGHPKGWGSR